MDQFLTNDAYGIERLGYSAFLRPHDTHYNTEVTDMMVNVFISMAKVHAIIN
jgi:hypothetical protein